MPASTAGWILACTPFTDSRIHVKRIAAQRLSKAPLVLQVDDGEQVLTHSIVLSFVGGVVPCLREPLQDSTGAGGNACAAPCVTPPTCRTASGSAASCSTPRKRIDEDATQRVFVMGALSAAAKASCSRSVGGLPAPAPWPLDTTPGEGRGLQELHGTGNRATAGASTTAAGIFAPFAIGLLRSAAPTGNAVLSPYSVLNALGMTQLGAAGGTAQRLAQLLGGNGSAVAARLTVVDDALEQAVRKANERLESTGSGQKGTMSWTLPTRCSNKAKWAPRSPISKH